MTRNWAGNLTYGASTLHEPSSVEGLQEIVASTSRIRPLGSRHSFNRIADTNAVQVSVARLPDTCLVNDDSTVTVNAGVRYGELVNRLDGASTTWLKSRGDNPRTELFDATAATAGVHPLPGLSAEFTTQQLGQPGPWWDRLPHFRLEFTPNNGEELQTEYLVPRTDVLVAIDAVRALASQVQPLLLVSEICTIAADSLWLSPSHSVDCVALHFTWRQDIPAVTALLPTLDDTLAPLAARPHWGKLFETTPERLNTAYPKLAQFRQLIETSDPKGKFANDLTRQWLGQH